MNENIENKLIKFLMNTANIDDLEVLTNWLKNDQNKQIFKNYIRTNYAMDINTNQFDTENAKKEYLRKIRKDKKLVHRLKIYKVFKYAAAAVILFGLGYFYQQGVFNEPQFTEPIIVNNNIEVGSDKATLTLENGEEVTLTKGTSFQTPHASSNGEEIIYNSKAKTKDIAYNTLTIPRGGQFQITLTDGTQVWLNSESQLKYPVTFTDGETRQVELVYGEAYFDVSPSTEHNGSKFKIFNQSQEVEVLGTEFNIKAYKGETNIYTTLVEGKVAINTENLNKVLKPGEQSNLNIQLNTIQINEVDIFREVSWKDGTFSFKHKSLKDIMTVLSRWYDMDVVFENKEIENVTFNGTLYKNQSIEEILVFIQSSVNTYEINNKTIILK